MRRSGSTLSVRLSSRRSQAQALRPGSRRVDKILEWYILPARREAHRLFLALQGFSKWVYHHLFREEEWGFFGPGLQYAEARLFSFRFVVHKIWGEVKLFALPNLPHRQAQNEASQPWNLVSCHLSWSPLFCDRGEWGLLESAEGLLSSKSN